MNKKQTSFSRNQRAILVCIAFLAVFLLFTISRTIFHPIDVAINLWTPTIQTAPLNFMAAIIAAVFDTTSLVLIALVIAAYLFIRNYKAQSLLLLTAMGGDALIVSIIKNLDQVARPTNAISVGSGFSYPSGHSAGVIVFCGVLAYFAWLHWRSNRSRALVAVGFGVLASVVGFDRIYLNVHWLSDVFGGWLFGAFWLSFVIITFQRLETAGKLESDRFNLVAKLLFVVAVLVAVLIVLWGLIGNYLFH